MDLVPKLLQRIRDHGTNSASNQPAHGAGSHHADRCSCHSACDFGASAQEFNHSLLVRFRDVIGHYLRE